MFSTQAPPLPGEMERTPTRLEGLAERFVALWGYPYFSSPVVRTALLIAVACLCLLRAYTGTSGIVAYSHDGVSLLDGAWRVLSGQKPHADFYSPLGPAIYLATAFGLLLAHGGAEGFGYSQAVCGGLLGLWAYRVSRHRLGDLAGILFCLWVVFFAMNPTSIGEQPPVTSCMPYNRYGYALVAILLVEALAKRDPFGRSTEFRGGISSGAVLALLLFLKISYFVGAAALLAALIPCRTQVKARWAGIFCGFLPVLLIFCAYLGFDLVPMWKDFRMVGGAKPVRVNWFIVDNLYRSVAGYLAFIFVAARFLPAPGAGPDARNVRIAGVAVCATGVFLLATNYQFCALPLSPVMALLVFTLKGAKTGSGHRLALRHAALLVWGGLYVAGSLGYDALGLGYGVAQKQALEGAPHSVFQAGALAGFRTFESGYVDLVNDGLALLRQHRRPDDTVMSLDYANPFSYALGMPPAPGGSSVLHYPGSFTDSHHPAPERLFGQASLVMVPVVPSDQGLTRSIPRIYGPYLAAQYRLVGETPAWRLYRHN